MKLHISGQISGKAASCRNAFAQEDFGPPVHIRTGLRLLCLALCALLIGSSSLQAEEKPEPSGKQTRIVADKVVYSRQENTVRFEGNVHAAREAFEIWCTEMTVFVAKEGAAGGENGGQPSLQSQRNFERIVAVGDVRLHMDNRTAESRKAVYEAKSETLTLTGNVRLREGRNTIQGEKVKLYLKEDRSEVMSGEEGQVEATFYSSEEDESQ